jgi:hypothetical protein
VGPILSAFDLRALRRVVHDIAPRARLDSGIDRLRFRMDTFPRRGPLAGLSGVGYQPLPWLGVQESRRTAGTMSRWRAISSTLDSEVADARTALDLGANVGFFTVSLARRGIKTLAVETDDVAHRTAAYSLRRAGLDHAGLALLRLSAETIDLLPTVDVVLFLSLWHHFVREYGLDDAKGLLTGIWERTRRALFFDSGEREMPPHYGLPPLEPDPQTWLARLLAEACVGGTVRQLGRHEAFAPDGRPVERNLFVVLRARVS